MSERRILSSNRVVLTIEDEDGFWVFHSSHCHEGAKVSGPFDLHDRRFSRPLESEA